MEIGIALSGGGARGIAHLGVVKALKELGYGIEAYSGVSSGAIAAVFLAAGVTPDELLKLFKGVNLYSLLRPNMLSPGFLDSNALRLIYEKHLPVQTFEELHVPVIIGTTDILKGKRVYFRKGNLLTPLLASSSVPVMFKAVQYEGYELVDGGLLNNLPIEPLVGFSRKILASHCNPIAPKGKLRSTRQYFERSMQLLISHNVINSMPLCDFLIEPPALGDFGVTQFSRAEDIFKAGYKFTLANAAEIAQALGD